MASVDTIAKIEGDADDGGWSATGAVFNDADRLSFYQRVRAWYSLYTSAGWTAAPRVAFRGHLLPDPWQKLFGGSTAPWTGQIAHEMMKEGEVQGIFYRSVSSSPGNRHQIINMKYAHIIYELMSGHCNLMHKGQRAAYDSTLWGGAFTSRAYNEGFVGLNLDITNSSAVSQYDLKQGGFWERLKEIANIDGFILFVDKTNKLHYTRHPMFGTLPTAVMTITSSHLLAPLQITRRNEKIGQIKLQGTTPAGLQIRGKYPTHPTAGPIIVKKGYMATSNALMNTIATRMYKYANRDVSVVATLPGAVGLMLELMDRIAITYASSADGISWSSKKFWIQKISVSLQSDFNAVTTLTLEAENS
jgi:hypothetical protein